MNPQVAESTATGGADFLCEPEAKEPFVLEVTSLNRDAVEERSGWPDELDEQVRAFSMITPNLWSKARTKTPQLTDQGAPGILAITLNHIGAAQLLGARAADWMMVSEPTISVPLASKGKSTPSASTTNLKKAAFIRIQEGQVVPVRQSISAVLLIAIWAKELGVVGLLHPAPSVPFDYRTFSDVPFLRLKWSVKESRLQLEWIVAQPGPARYGHSAISLSEPELKGE